MRIREVSPLVEGSLEERTADYNTNEQSDERMLRWHLPFRFYAMWW
jgi:hypothetical protein